MQYKGGITVGYTRGAALSDWDIQNVVYDALNAKALPVDGNAVYFVITASDVTATSGYGTSNTYAPAPCVVCTVVHGRAVLVCAMLAVLLHTPIVYFANLVTPCIPASFCKTYCGWHTYGNYGSTAIKYAFIGNAITQCPYACTEQATSPNDNQAADGMTSIIAHELAEATSDPLVRC